MREREANPEDDQNLPAQSQAVQGEVVQREQEAKSERVQDLTAQSQAVQRGIVQVDTEWNAPLPSPIDFRGYEDTLPGAANRILEMAENEQDHRHQRELSALEIARTSIVGDSWKSRSGMALGFALGVTGIACGTYLSASGHDISGMALFLASLASLVGVSIYGIKTQISERRRDAEED